MPGPSTRSVHLLSETDPATRAVVAPLVANAAFAYDTVADWRRVALGEVPGDIYSRNSNPTVRLFEQKMAALEGADGAVAFANGMGAIASTLFALLSPGQRAVTLKDAYGGTYLTFTELLPRFQVQCAVCETDDAEAIEAAIGGGCDLLYLETPTNPTLKVVDLARLAAAAHRAGAIVIVDNTFATPINQQPLALGADLVIHSATKFIGGHGDAMGGVVCGRRDLTDRIYRWREIAGGALDAQNAFLLLRSLKTLGLRIARQNDNAMGVSRYLETHPAVARVHYPGLPSHAAHAIAARQMSGFGGMLSFELRGGLEAATRVLDHLDYAYLAANLGQVETVAGPPSLTSHVELTAEERAAAGVPEGLIRYSVGIEDLDDLIGDLRSALDAL
ncbi:MAG: aminotransferase class I/II-fold pyridoxal phosphate-dependent enzyme [Vicinamibacterales bacterium]|nr:aminotransferase class I/II-fold pyridoxal phosphate-dependent enzyme [Vicinamibacterales bacterium]